MKNKTRVILMTVGLLLGAAIVPAGWRWHRVAAQSTGLSGTYGYTATVQYTGGSTERPFALIGVLTFDGAGRFTGSQTVVMPDPSPNATTVLTDKQSIAGTYTLNSDGTGTMQIENPNGTIPLAIVVTDGGAGLMVVQTGGGNFLLTATARRQ